MAPNIMSLRKDPLTSLTIFTKKEIHRNIKEFKEFAMRGNVVDMAVVIIIGAAFGKIITSIINDVIMPPNRFVYRRC